MRIITLAQSATNLVAQFIKIVLKILAPYLRDGAKLFLDDIRVKRPKTIYNNKELTSGIRQYVIKHIQNFDKVLADLKQMGVTIAGAKSQFCQAGIKIVGYICNANGCHSDTSKLLKILD